MTSIDVVCRVAGMLADRTVSGFVLARVRGGSRDDVLGCVPGTGTWRPLPEIIGALCRNIGQDDRDLVREALWTMGLPRVTVAQKTTVQKLAGALFK